MDGGERRFLGCSQDVFTEHGQEDFCTRDNWQTAVLYLAQVHKKAVNFYVQSQPTFCIIIKQVRKLRWSVAFVILQNCDSISY